MECAARARLERQYNRADARFDTVRKRLNERIGVHRVSNLAAQTEGDLLTPFSVRAIRPGGRIAREVGARIERPARGSSVKSQCYIKERLMADLAATANWIAAIEQREGGSRVELAEALQRRADLLRQIKKHEAEHRC